MFISTVSKIGQNAIVLHLDKRQIQNMQLQQTRKKFSYGIILQFGFGIWSIGLFQKVNAVGLIEQNGKSNIYLSSEIISLFDKFSY